MCLNEAFFDGFKDGFIIFRPESFLAYDMVHEMFLGKYSGLTTTMAVENTEVSVF